MKKILLAALALAVAGAAAFVVYQNLPMKRHARHMVKARLFAKEGNLAAARLEYEKAFKITEGFTPYVSLEVLKISNQLSLQENNVEEALSNTRKFTDKVTTNREGWLLLADLELRAGRPAEALEALSSLLNKDPDYFPGRLMLAQIRSRQGRLDLAEEQLRYLYAKAPDSLSSLLPLAENLLRQGQVAESRVFLAQALKDHPKNGAARLLLLDGYLLERMPDSAERLLDEWKEAEPSLAMAIAVRRSDIRAAQGRFAEADSALRPHLEKSEKALPVWGQLAVLRAKAGLYDSADAIYARMGDIKPAAKGEYLLLQCYLRLKIQSPAKALEALKLLEMRSRVDATRPLELAAYLSLGQDHKVKELLAEGPDSAKARLASFASQMPADKDFIGQWALVNYWQALRQTYMVRQAVQELYAKWPSSALAATLHANNLASVGAFKEAAAILERQKAPSLAQRLARVTLLARGGDREKARAAAEGLLAEQPSQRGLNLYLADYHYGRKDTAKAIFHYEKELALDTGNVIVSNNLAWEYGVNKRDLAKAKPHLDRLKKGGNSDPRIMDTVGWILALNGGAEGVDYLRSALSLVPDQPTFAYHLAWALAQKGDKAEAKRLLDGALSGKRTFPEADSARALAAKL